MLPDEVVIELQILSEKIAIVSIYEGIDRLYNLVYYFEIQEDKIKFKRGNKMNF